VPSVVDYANCAIFAQYLNTKTYVLVIVIKLHNKLEDYIQLEGNMTLNIFGKIIKIFENTVEQKREKNRKEVIESWNFWKQGGI